MIARSKAYPLNVILALGPMTHISQRPTLLVEQTRKDIQILQEPHLSIILDSSRLRGFDLQGHACTAPLAEKCLKVLSQQETSESLLQSLKISLGLINQLFFPTQFLNIRKRNLRQLDLVNVSIDWRAVTSDNLGVTNLLSLCLASITPSIPQNIILNLIPSSPNLTRLALSSCLPSAFLPPGEEEIRNLSLTSLRTCLLRDDFLPSYQLFHRFNVPSSTKLTLQADRYGPGPIEDAAVFRTRVIMFLDSCGVPSSINSPRAFRAIELFYDSSHMGLTVSSATSDDIWHMFPIQALPVVLEQVDAPRIDRLEIDEGGRSAEPVEISL